MPIKLPCPRCKQALSLSSKMADSYVTCPSCKGRIWVPAQGSAKASHPGSTSAGEPTAPPAGGAMAVPPTLPSSSEPASAPSRISPSDESAKKKRRREKQSAKQESSKQPKAQPPAAQPPPSAKKAGSSKKSSKATPTRPGKKVARFITSQPVRSTIDIAEDGKLPEMHYSDNEIAKKKKKDKDSTTNPLVLFGVLCLSMVMCVALVFVDSDSVDSSLAKQKEVARQAIESDYFSSLEGPEPREPYQLHLREAQRAHSRRDYRRERALYRKVLGLLRSERGALEGITGSRTRDRELEEMLIILLRD